MQTQKVKKNNNVRNGIQGHAKVARLRYSAKGNVLLIKLIFIRKPNEYIFHILYYMNFVCRVFFLFLLLFFLMDVQIDFSAGFYFLMMSYKFVFLMDEKLVAFDGIKLGWWVDLKEICRQLDFIWNRKWKNMNYYIKNMYACLWFMLFECRRGRWV